jgi:hypothetical protein
MRDGAMTKHQMFYDRQGMPMDLETWITKSGDPKYRRVASTVLPDGKQVSTVWIGLNYHTFRGPPLIFETMDCPSEDSDFDSMRYSTEEEALVGHNRLVEKWSKPQQ